jgi:Restriction Enzyme Adenine Methylase Associated
LQFQAVILDSFAIRFSTESIGGGMAKRKPHQRRRREALVHQHLENVSRELFERHPDVVRQFIGRNAGIYALYRKKKLYYVGLAVGLRGRLRAHVKNKHGKSWDRFSIYLTIKDQHLREIEALLLRIANPPGARQRGKLAQSKDMRRRVARAIREKQYSEVSALFGRETTPITNQKLNGADSDLLRLLPQGARLRGTLKKRVYRARVRPNGKIRFNGKFYKSLSVAAYAAIKRPTNGWWFWQIERGRGNWVRLNKIRKAGTPVYIR